MAGGTFRFGTDRTSVRVCGKSVTPPPHATWPSCLSILSNNTSKQRCTGSLPGWHTNQAIYIPLACISLTYPHAAQPDTQTRVGHTRGRVEQHQLEIILLLHTPFPASEKTNLAYCLLVSWPRRAYYRREGDQVCEFSNGPIRASSVDRVVVVP